LPLIVGFDGKPLSKRNGSLSVEELRAQGYFPQAILNYLSRLGHHYDKTQDKHNMNLIGLGEHFQVGSIGRSPAHFDLTQLEHWQKEAIQAASLEEMWAWMQPVVENIVPEDASALFVDCIRSNIVRPEDARFWAENVFNGVLVLTDEALKVLQEAGHDFYHGLFESIQLHGDDYKMVLESMKQKTSNRGRNLFMPIRVAISGLCHGPEMEKLFALLGRKRLVARLQFILENYLKEII
jgi:glutamyl-tRNA synthetase